MIIYILLVLLMFPSIGHAELSLPESNRAKTLASLKKIDDFPLYVMHYYGDYPIPHYSLERSPLENDQKQAMSEDSFSWGCTCFSALTAQGENVLGRNFDWDDHPALLVFTNPPNRYASVSIVDISYFGYSKTNGPEKNPERLLNSPRLPFDGMNEHGLAVGMMAVPASEATSDPKKETIGSLMAIRLILDYAKNVDEAIAVFKNFNIDFTEGPCLHYLITDRSNNSAVVEFVNQKISVLRNSHPWQTATNFIITRFDPEEARKFCWRYNMVWETLKEENKKISISEAFSLLKKVSQSNTIWTVVYNTNTLDFHVVMGRKYDQMHKFTFK